MPMEFDRLRLKDGDFLKLGFFRVQHFFDLQRQALARPHRADLAKPSLLNRIHVPSDRTSITKRALTNHTPR